MNWKVKRWLLTNAIFQHVRLWMKKVSLGGHHNISLYRFTSIFVSRLIKNDIWERSYGVAYNFILSIFPAIIFLFTLIPYISQRFPEVNNENIMELITTLLPENMHQTVYSTILDIVNTQRRGLLTFGFLFALFLSTNGMMSLTRAFNACYQTVERRSLIRMRITAVGLTIMLAVALMVAVVLLVTGSLLVSMLTENIAHFSSLNLAPYTIYMLLTLRFFVVFIVFFVAISFIYYFGPAVHYNWRFFSTGSFISTLGILGVSYGFSYYITRFGTYNKVYGSIGVLIALMVWIQLITVVLLLGYEINASLHQSVKTDRRNAKIMR